MIVRITGILSSIETEGVVLDRDGIAYEVFIPAFVRDALSDKIGQPLTFHTLEYYEGSAVGGNLFPRLVGFLKPDDKAFFLHFIKVKGVGYRKALRAFARSTQQIASAIEGDDVNFLSSLPEIGKRTAEQLVASLRGKLKQFITAGGEPAADHETTPLDRIQNEALEILIQLGEKRNDALEWIKKVCPENVEITDPAKIVERIYKRKAGAL